MLKLYKTMFKKLKCSLFTIKILSSNFIVTSNNMLSQYNLLMLMSL